MSTEFPNIQGISLKWLWATCASLPPPVNISQLPGIYQRRGLQPVNTQRKNFHHEKRKTLCLKQAAWEVCADFAQVCPPSRALSLYLAKVTVLCGWNLQQLSPVYSRSSADKANPSSLQQLRYPSFEIPSAILPLLSSGALAQLPIFSKSPFLYL